MARNNGNGDRNNDQQADDSNSGAEQNPLKGKDQPGSEEQMRAEGQNRDRQEGKPSDEALATMRDRTSDQRSVPGGEQSLEQPAPGVAFNHRTDAHSPMPEGDTAAHNAGNASPVMRVIEPAPTIRTEYANQRVMGIKPDPAPNPWPIAPKPVDPGLVSPSGVSGRPAHHEAAISSLTMRLGEMRNFLSGFAHRVILVEAPELNALVSRLKHALGLPDDPAEVAAARVGYSPLPAGPGSGGVARAGQTLPGTVSTTSAGSFAQGSYGPHGVQENNA